MQSMWIQILELLLLIPTLLVGIAIGRRTQRDEDRTARWQEIEEGPAEPAEPRAPAVAADGGFPAGVGAEPGSEAWQLGMQLAALRVHAPGADATDEEIAAWYTSKALLHEALAAQGGPDAHQEAAQAKAAREYAESLRGVEAHPTEVGA